MPQRLRRFSPKLIAAFLFAFTVLLAQDSSTFYNSNVIRVGERLACRCGGCRNTVGSCPMLHCESADPMRRRIAAMQASGKTDDTIISEIVRDEGIVALASPPATGFGLFTWIMPAVALLIGFFIYSSWVKRNRATPQPVSAEHEEVFHRFQSEIDDELDDSEPRGAGK